MEPKRLNKFISDSGFCSRREADELLEQGRVTVNNKIPQPGTMVTAKDKVRIDDQLVNVREEAPVFLAFNKPAGIANTTDTSARNNIISAINYPASIKPIGLMDRDAEGLMFLSNDSELVNRMTKGDYKYEKEYVVTVDKIITPDFLEKMSEGGHHEPGEVIKKNQVSKIDPSRFRLVLEPGTNHHVKRIVEGLGYKLVKLKRTRIHNLTLGKMATGHWRALTADEVDELRKVLSTKATRATVNAPVSYRQNKEGYKGKAGSAREAGINRERKAGGARPARAGSSSSARATAAGGSSGNPANRRTDFKTGAAAGGAAKPASKRTATKAGANSQKVSRGATKPTSGRGSGSAAGKKSAPRGGASKKTR